ncbi:MAG: hypothetical protein A2Y33_07240 [Spirochaetes bacterium GWF1_51_8]|nr:MAG: hypothetical protein A2Y33_07240 [Spirochaetes bacterium GWF1_51_8]
MPKKSNVWISPTPSGDWKVQRENGQIASAVVSTQAEAIKVGTRIAKNNGLEVVIQRPNGQIRDKRSHGNDPFPPKG